MAPGLRGWGDGRDAADAGGPLVPAAVEGRRGVSAARPGDRRPRRLPRPGSATGWPATCPTNLAHPMPPPARRHAARALGRCSTPTTSSARSCATPPRSPPSCTRSTAPRCPPTLVADVVARHARRRAVVSPEPAADAVARPAAPTSASTSSGVTVAAAPPPTSGVTSRVAAIATTGTRRAGLDASPAAARPACCRRRTCASSRPAGSWPSSAEVLRALPATAPLPSNLVLDHRAVAQSATSSRSSSLGVHGPIAVEIVVLPR